MDTRKNPLKITQYDRVLLPVNLKLFDGGAGGASGGGGAAAGASSGGSGTTAGAASGDGGTGTAPTVGAKPAAGKGATPAAAATSEDATAATAKDATAEEKRSAFQNLIEGEYKEQFAEALRQQLARRLRTDREDAAQAAKQAEQAQELFSLLAQRYHADPGDIAAIAKAVEDDTAYWTAEAEREGLGVEQLKTIRRMERENARLKAQNQRQLEAEARRERDAAAQRVIRQLKAEAEPLKAKYPDLDVEKELRNPDFFAILKSGASIEAAYQAVHFHEIMEGTRAAAAAEAERKVTENVRARGTRPLEAGAGQSGAFSTKVDVSKLTREEMDAIKARVMRQERVSFG